MLAFLAKMTKKQNKNIFVADNVLKEAKDFYAKKCGFVLSDGNTYIIKNKQIDNLISQNEFHTKGSIEFLG